jgi:hypothetical protein
LFVRTSSFLCTLGFHLDSPFPVSDVQKLAPFKIWIYLSYSISSKEMMTFFALYMIAFENQIFKYLWYFNRLRDLRGLAYELQENKTRQHDQPL